MAANLVLEGRIEVVGSPYMKTANWLARLEIWIPITKDGFGQKPPYVDGKRQGTGD